MDDDYYSLLGVKPSAEAADIKAAYRDKKAAFDGKGAKGSVAALNKAWNVLSDPYQRGRYDAGREQVGDGVAEPGDDGESVEAAPPARRGFFSPAPPRDRNAPKPSPTIDVPPGYALAEPRRRVTAMVIDLFILLIVFVGSQYAAGEYVNSQHQSELDSIEALDEQIDDLQKERNELADGRDDLKAEDPVPEEKLDVANDEIKTLNGRIDAFEDQRADLEAELGPAGAIAFFGSFAFALLYLAVPSALTGRTVGKKLRDVEVVRVDGGPLGLTGALYRYGLLVVGAMAMLAVLGPVLGPLAPAIVLFVVLGWMRNPNQQGLHDRTSKTLVVTEASDG